MQAGSRTGPVRNASKRGPCRNRAASSFSTSAASGSIGSSSPPACRMAAAWMSRSVLVPSNHCSQKNSRAESRSNWRDTRSWSIR